jgi:hypothetical protein
VEIDEKTNRRFGEFDVSQDLRFMDRVYFLDCLDFEYNAVLDEKVDTKRVPNFAAVVKNKHRMLAAVAHPSIGKLHTESVIIYGFQKSRTKLLVNLKTRVDDSLRDWAPSLVVDEWRHR